MTQVCSSATIDSEKRGDNVHNKTILPQPFEKWITLDTKFVAVLTAQFLNAATVDRSSLYACELGRGQIANN